MSSPAPHRHRRAGRWLLLVWLLAGGVNVAMALGLASGSSAVRFVLLAAGMSSWAVIVYRARHLRAVPALRRSPPAPSAQVVGGPCDGLLWSAGSAGELPAQLWLPAGDGEQLYRLTPGAHTGPTGQSWVYWYQNQNRARST